MVGCHPYKSAEYILPWGHPVAVCGCSACGCRCGCDCGCVFSQRIKRLPPRGAADLRSLTCPCQMAGGCLPPLQRGLCVGCTQGASVAKPRVLLPVLGVARRPLISWLQKIVANLFPRRVPRSAAARRAADPCRLGCQPRRPRSPSIADLATIPSRRQSMQRSSVGGGPSLFSNLNFQQKRWTRLTENTHTCKDGGFLKRWRVKAQFPEGPSR